MYISFVQDIHVDQTTFYMSEHNASLVTLVRSEDLKFSKQSHGGIKSSGLLCCQLITLIPVDNAEQQRRHEP
jgi:hypothetical protein